MTAPRDKWRPQPVTVALGVTWLLCMTVNIGLYASIVFSNDRRVIEAVDTLGDIQVHYDSEILNYFQGELASGGITELPAGQEQLLATLSWVGNQITVAESHTSPNPIDILEGGTAICGGMSAVFTAAAQSLGYRAREIDLLVSPANLMDTHVTVEVFVDDAWRVFDPTFNTTFVAPDAPENPLGVEAIRDALMYGAPGSVIADHQGAVAYPARLDTYYMNWQPLFNNIYVRQGSLSPRDLSLTSRILNHLPLAAWFPRQRTYHLLPDAKLWRSGFTRDVVFRLAYLFLPLANLVLTAGLIVLAVRGHRAGRVQQVVTAE